MAPSKRKKAPAAAAPVSALAARKAREQAQASPAKERHTASASRSRSSRRSSSRNDDAESDGEELNLEVVLPLPTASQAAASRPSARSSLPSPSTLKRPRRSSVTQDPDSIAATRPRRNSSAASPKPSVSTPKSTSATPAKAAQSTPTRSSARNTPASKVTPTSSKATPISSKKKGKARFSLAADANDDEDQDLLRDLDQIIADFTGKAQASDDEASEAEQPPRKKRAKQAATVETPSKSRRQSIAQPESSSKSKRSTPSKPIPSKPIPSTPSPSKPTPSERTPPKRSPAKKEPVVITPPKKAAAKTASPKKASPEKADSTPAKASSSSSEPQHPTKKKLTADQERIRQAKRYFAAAERKRGKTRVSSSALPVEDEATGFLAFGNDDDDDEEEEEVEAADEDDEEGNGEEKQVGPDSDDSSEDDEPQNERAKHVSSPVNGRQNGANGNAKRDEAPSPSKRTKIVLDDNEDEEEDDDDDDNSGHTESDTHALSREALLDAVPYSRFTPILEGESKNMHLIENKRKRGKEALYFGLRKGETLVFLGIGHVEVLQGSVQIGGAVISSTPEGFNATDIYAPISNPLPVLKAVSASRYPGHGAAAIASHGSSDNQSQFDVDGIFDSVFDTVVKLTPLSSPITALGQVCPIGGLATLFSMPPSLELSNKVHQLSTIKVLLEPSIADLVQKQKQKNSLANGIFPTVGLSATYIPHKWQAALHRLSSSALSAAQHPQEESVVALIRGNKKVGKSTLSRMALERLLSMGKVVGSKVAYLELDLGQSDFGPPGMVALHLLSLADKISSESVDNTQSETVDDEDLVFKPIEALSQGAQEEATPPAASAQANPPRAPRSCVTIGPGWCQPRVPVRAHFIGDVSPRDNPEGYVAAVHDLIEFFRAQIQLGQPDENGISQRVPLVINTQGWIKGLGADLAARIEPLLRPTHIFDVIPRGSPDPVPAPTRGQPWLDAEGAILGSGPEIVFLESVSQLEFVQNTFGQQRHSNGSSTRRDANETNGTSTAAEEKNEPGDGGSVPPRYITEVGSKLAPAEARLLNMMSYLYATQLAPAGPDNGFKIEGTWDFSQPLVHRRPLIIDVRRGLKAGIRVLPLGSSVPDNLKLMALNASIVAIIVTDHRDAPQNPEEDAASAEKQQDISSMWKQTFDRAAQISQPEFGLSTRCVGLGIVRSIDVLAGDVHMITPLDTAFLKELESSTGSDIGLVKGALEVPVWASLDFDTIKEARESRLDVPPATTYPSNSLSGDVEGQQSQPAQKLLAGMPRNQVPYLEFPHSAMASSRQNGKQIALNGSSSNNNAGTSSPLPLGSEKRRIRRNLMRKSQFA